MKTFCVQLRNPGAIHSPGRQIYRVADEWKIQDGFVMFTCHESSIPVFAIHLGLVFSIEVQDDS